MTQAVETNLTTVVVARGRSIQVGDRLYIAGEEAPVPAAEVEHLRACGFVHDPDATIPSRTTPRAADNPAAVGLQRTET